jgi:hypothetical protein
MRTISIKGPDLNILTAQQPAAAANSRACVVRHTGLRPPALHAGNRFPLATLPNPRRVTADSQRHSSRGKKRK